MEKVEESKRNNLKHKSFLLFTKIIPHVSALFYIVYTLFQFADIDLLILGYLFSFSLLPWIYMLCASLIFKYCYVHRLPLYYILLNEFLTVTDYYIRIPVNDFNLLLIHLLFIGLLIFGYSYYYLKKIKRNEIYSIYRNV